MIFFFMTGGNLFRWENIFFFFWIPYKMRGGVEELPINEIEVVAFEEAEEGFNLPDGVGLVEIEEGIFLAMDIDDYNDFLLRQQEQFPIDDES